MKLTQSRLMEIAHYDPVNGIFVYRIRKAHRNIIGQQIGYDSGHGYRKVCIDYKRYYLHRLAWLYMTGQWPAEQIDHINLNRSDNRWANLRQASNQFNNQNRRSAHSTSKIGLLGVTKRNHKFAARIRAEGREIHLGVFDTPQLAHAAYILAKRKLHASCTL